MILKNAKAKLRDQGPNVGRAVVARPTLTLCSLRMYIPAWNTRNHAVASVLAEEHSVSSRSKQLADFEYLLYKSVQENFGLFIVEIRISVL